MSDTRLNCPVCGRRDAVQIDVSIDLRCVYCDALYDDLATLKRAIYCNDKGWFLERSAVIRLGQHFNDIAEWERSQ